MAVFASQAKVIIINNKSSKRITISLPGTSPTIISGERSIEKINITSPASVFTSVNIKTIIPKTNARGTSKENLLTTIPKEIPMIEIAKKAVIVATRGDLQFIRILTFYSLKK
jgi:hypothetical protein